MSSSISPPYSWRESLLERKSLGESEVHCFSQTDQISEPWNSPVCPPGLGGHRSASSQRSDPCPSFYMGIRIRTQDSMLAQQALQLVTGSFLQSSSPPPLFFIMLGIEPWFSAGQASILLGDINPREIYVYLFTYLLIYSFIYFSCLSTYLSILLSVLWCCEPYSVPQECQESPELNLCPQVLFNAVIVFLRTAFTLKVYVQGKWKTAYCCSSHPSGS